MPRHGHSKSMQHAAEQNVPLLRACCLVDSHRYPPLLDDCHQPTDLLNPYIHSRSHLSVFSVVRTEQTPIPVLGGSSSLITGEYSQHLHGVHASGTALQLGPDVTQAFHLRTSHPHAPPPYHLIRNQ